RRCAASRCWELRYGCLVHRRVVLTRPAPKRGGVPQLGRLLALAWGAGCPGWDACGLRLGRWLSRARRRWLRTGALGTSDKTTAGAEKKVLGGLGQEAAVSGREPVVAVAREPRPGRPGGPAASSRVRAVATRSSQPRHPDAAPAGSAHGSLDRTNRTPGRASHRSSTRTSSGLAPRSGPRAGRTVSAPATRASTTGIGGTPRRAVPAEASLPWRMTANSQPPEPSG